MTERQERTIGRYAWAAAWVGLAAGQVHALARFRTEDGKEDLERPLAAAWAEPADDMLAPVLDWAGPDLVYVTYGKIWLPVFLGFTLCAVAAYRRRRPRGFEEIAWRLAIGAYAVACVAVALDYWTQWTGNYEGDGLEATVFEIAFFVTVPAMLATLLFSTLLGVTLLTKRFRPTLPAVVLAVTIPLAAATLTFTSMGSAALPVMFAFGILGRRMARETEDAGARAGTPAVHAMEDASRR